MTIVDLSHPLTTGMPVYPGDPEVRIAPALDLADDGVAVTALHLGSHSGTHIDAPSHTVPGGRTMSEVDLTELVGPGLVVRVPVPSDPEAAAGTLITAEMLAPALPERVPGIVVLASGWDRYWGSGEYFDHPVLSAEAARMLMDRGMHVLGIDWLNPDPTSDESDFAVHAEVLGRDGLIVENLRGVFDLAPQGVVELELVIAPLALRDTDGAPVRAFARV